MTSTIESDDEQMYEVLPIGTDVSKLFVSEALEDIDIEFNGEVWQFTIKPITWAAEGEIMNNAMNLNMKGKNKKSGDVNAKFNVGVYNREYLKRIIVKAPFIVNDASLLRLDPKLGDLLVEKLIDRVDEEDVKN